MTEAHKDIGDGDRKWQAGKYQIDEDGDALQKN